MKIKSKLSILVIGIMAFVVIMISVLLLKHAAVVRAVNDLHNISVVFADGGRAAAENILIDMHYITWFTIGLFIFALCVSAVIIFHFPVYKK